MKKMVTLALVLGVGLTQINAQVEQATTTDVENQKKQNVVARIMDDLRENTHAVHQTNKENFATEKAAFSARHEKATMPNPDFVEFKQTKGLKNKTKVVVASIKKSSREISEREQERRTQIKLYESNKNLLTQQNKV